MEQKPGEYELFLPVYFIDSDWDGLYIRLELKYRVISGKEKKRVLIYNNANPGKAIGLRNKTRK